MPTSAYRTADGYINIGASGNHMWTRLAGAIGRADLLDDTRFANDPDRAEHRVPLNAAINDALAAKTNAEWIEILNQAGVPSGPIYALDQVFADPQVRHEQAAASVQHPVLGEIKLVNQAVKLSRTPAALANPTPELGQHTDEILAALGYDASRIETWRAQKVI
jgi:formyl-CoA transferase